MRRREKHANPTQKPDFLSLILVAEGFWHAGRDTTVAPPIKRMRLHRCKKSGDSKARPNSSPSRR